MGAHHLDVLDVKRLRERRRGGERGDGEGGVAGESEDGAELGELLSEICPVLRADKTSPRRCSKHGLIFQATSRLRRRRYSGSLGPRIKIGRS